MKKTIAAFSLALVAGTAMAQDRVFGDNPEMYGSPLLDHASPHPHIQVQRGVNEEYASLLIPQPADHLDTDASQTGASLNSNIFAGDADHS